MEKQMKVVVKDPGKKPEVKRDPEQYQEKKRQDLCRMNPRWVWTDPGAFFDRDDREFYHDRLQEQQETM